jgi:hypothetical protein
MAEPDFTLLPVYESMKNYIASARVMYPGWYQEDHWAVEWSGTWKIGSSGRFTFGRAKESEGNGSLRFTFEGNEAALLASGSGAITVRVDGQQSQFSNLQSAITRLPLARNLPAGRHTVEITTTGPVIVDGFSVRRAPDLAPGLALLLGVVLALLALVRWRRGA